MVTVKHRLLSAVEEQGLASRVAAGDRAAINTLVECNLAMVFGLVRKRNGCGIDYNDLVQEGMIGLMHAAAKYRSGHGSRFSTYAYPWIKNAITRFIDRNLRMTSGGINETGVDGKQRPSKRREPVVRLDRSVGDHGMTIGEIIADTQAATEDAIIDLIDRKRVKNEIDSIPGRTGKILRMRAQDRTLAEAGVVAGCTKQAAQQVQKASIERLRKKFGTENQLSIKFG